MDVPDLARPANRLLDEDAVLPPTRFVARVEACFIADGDTFVTRLVNALMLDFTGIVGDLHAGTTRLSTVREPWHKRGTVIRNNRQVTVVSADELREVAAAMGIPAIRPEWIGANLVLSGVPDLSALPIGTRVDVPDGPVLFVEGDNEPCRVAGRSIAGHYAGGDRLDLAFPRHGRGKRGLIALVEKPGTLVTGAEVIVRIPAQRLYRAPASIAEPGR